MDHNGCPDGYEEWARQYFGLARSEVLKYVIKHPALQNDVDDLTQDMMLKFYIRDGLSWYDPNKTFETPSGLRTARFPTLFRSFVKKFLRTPVETLGKKAAREPVRLEQPVGNGELWMDVYAPIETNDLVEEVSYSTELERAYQHLATVQLSDDVTGDAVLEAMLVAADENGGRLRRAPVAEQFDVPVSTAGRWIHQVREELREIGFMRDPAFA